MIARLVTLGRSLGLGLLLIAAAAAVLLYSDLSSRRTATPAAAGQRQLRVAVVQHASIPALDDGMRGVIAALARRGYVDGGRVALRRYNAEGDMATANTIAKDVTSTDFDLIISISTASLQTIANANRFATPPRRHVFGVTSDPYGAGVGVSRENHADHPPYMTGYGSLPPVAEAFRLVKEIRPEVTRVGLVWNPTEANSVAATNLAREICKELGITLVEANAENATAVGESAAAVLSRGVDVMWLSPDVTVITAADIVLAATKRAGVPAFTSLPGNADKGALFDLGANYVSIGEAQGELAADVLDGRDPATVPVENMMPVELHINQLALEGLRSPWQIPPSVLDKADVVIDASGRRTRSQPAASGGGAAGSGPLARRMTVDLIEYADTPNAEMAREGVMEALAESGLVEGRDYELRRHTAQGDIATLSSIIDTALTRRTDLMLTLSTPTLQNAIARGRGTPVVFTLVSNPFIVDAGKSDNDHLPFVTGSYLDLPIPELLALLRDVRPTVRRIGTLYTPAELNSVYNKEQLEKAAIAAGFQFEAVGITTSSDVSDAAITLASRKLDVITQISDNLIAASFPAIMDAARRVRLPVITFSPAVADMGPLAILARDYRDNGVESGRMAVRVLRGEHPSTIPFVGVASLRYIVNLQVADAYKLQLPRDIVAKASRVSQ